jgi:hypothetical protein
MTGRSTEQGAAMLSTGRLLASVWTSQMAFSRWCPADGSMAVVKPASLHRLPEHGRGALVRLTVLLARSLIRQADQAIC